MGNKIGVGANRGQVSTYPLVRWAKFEAESGMGMSNDLKMSETTGSVRVVARGGDK
jgi:hypothetical protein